jgi:hypothetical protein
MIYLLESESLCINLLSSFLTVQIFLTSHTCHYYSRLFLETESVVYLLPPVYQDMINVICVCSHH